MLSPPLRSLTLVDLLDGMRSRWLWIIPPAIMSSAAAYLWANAQPRIYRAETEFVYVSPPDKGREAASGALAGVASLLGTSSRSGADKPYAMGTLQSRELLADFITRHKLLPGLFPDRWDHERRVWAVPASKVPTPVDGAEVMREKNLNVEEDVDIGTLSLSLDLPTGYDVAGLANDLLRTADRRLRERARDESQRSLQYLHSQLNSATNADLQSSITDLIVAELNRLTLSRTKTSYAFLVIDPAVAPKAPVFPRPRVFAAVAGVLALFIGVMLSALVDLVRSERNRAL